MVQSITRPLGGPVEHTLNTISRSVRKSIPIQENLRFMKRPRQPTCSR